jgi:hypothetical protein
MRAELFMQSAYEFAEQGKNPDDGPYAGQPLMHDRWLTFFYEKKGELEREAQFANS